MHVITHPLFIAAEQKFPNRKEAIRDAFKILEKNIFKSPDELCDAFPSLDNFKYRDKW